MPSKFEVTSRNFSPKLAPELSDEARKAVNAAFDTMSTWRTETVENFERGGCLGQWQQTNQLAHLIVTIGDYYPSLVGLHAHQRGKHG